MTDERSPPYSEPSERGILGSILLDGARVVGLCIEAGLTPESFYVPAHRIIYTAMEWMASHNKGIDTLTVTAILRKSNKLDVVGGSIALDRLIDETPTAAHVEYYIDEVRGAWLLREMEKGTREALVTARQDDKDPQIVLAEHINFLTKIASRKERKDKAAAWQSVEEKHELAREGKLPGLVTPWSYFNNATGGPPSGVLTLVAGREGTRKSLLVLQWAMYDALHAKDTIPVAYFPFEDGTENAMRRAACILAGVSPDRFRRGIVDDAASAKVKEAGRKLVRSKLDIIGGRGRSVDSLSLEIARGVAKHGWKAVFLDAFKDIHCPQNVGAPADVYKSSRLFDVAERHDIPIIVVHHVSKMIVDDPGYGSREDQWLSYRNIKGFTEITADARMVIMLQCRARRGENDELVLDRYIIDAQKNNHGQTGLVKVAVDKEVGLFTEIPDQRAKEW